MTKSEKREVVIITAVLAFAAGCTKTEGHGTPAGGTVTPVANEAEAIAITGSPERASTSGTAAATPASAVPSGKGASVGANAKDAGALALTPAEAHVSGKNFMLHAVSPGCRVGTTCTMTLRLIVLGDYHVNKEYPYKFVATATPGITFLGNGDANTFSRAGGDFREDNEKAATMTVRWRPATAGDAKLEGTYKMSVCSAENCQMEQQAIALTVPVM